jgi:hypothetical protein
MLSDELLNTLATEVPSLALFAVALIIVVRAFLAHIKELTDSSQAFLKSQREAYDMAAKELANASAQAVRDLSAAQNQALTHLSDTMCAQMAKVTEGLNDLTVLSVSHDAFVRASFKERFGLAANERAQRAADAAEVAAVRK